ncbi:hypothetical protein VTP01DRAFT_1097 [Rhizomucor pusillus]|uniref:uncharacterized protein n=1 Tax=Rhizomucor pusillus TaxID=4840 RepID=UPI0037435A03
MSFPHETDTSTHSSALGESWASVAASAHERRHSSDDPSNNDETEFPLPQQVAQKDNAKASATQGVRDLLEKKNVEQNDSKDNESNQEETNTPYADKAREAAPRYTDQEYPLPQKTAQGKQSESVSSQGVGDLLNHNNNKDKKVPDPTVPPHPERSFATVAGNKDFPGLEITADASPVSGTSGEGESLSSIPDVKDMLGASSVKVPPPPPSQSFAKVAAKGDAEEKERTPAPRTVELRKLNDEAQKMQENRSLADKTHEEFPTLSQSNLMAGQGASPETKQDRALFTEISKLSEAADANEHERGSDATPQVAASPSFAHVTKSNLDEAPPSVPPKLVHTQPVYDEETMLADSARREMRKWRDMEEHEKPEKLEPEMEPMEQKKEAVEQYIEREAERKVEGKPTATEGSLVIKRRLELFDRRNKGKFTIIDTLLSLRKLGYWWFTAIPTAIIVHLRLSPLTSPYRFPFIYRSPIDLIRLPVYTDRVRPALACSAPLAGRPEVTERFGTRSSDGFRGLGFWGGVRALKYEEALQWWQFVPWSIHRLQWFVTYTVLQDPKSHLVSDSALVGIANEPNV